MDFRKEMRAAHGLFDKDLANVAFFSQERENSPGSLWQKFESILSKRKVIIMCLSSLGYIAVSTSARIYYSIYFS